MRGLRTDVMRRAAALAREEAPPEAKVYVVEARHVDDALSEIVRKAPALLQELLKLNAA